MNIDRLKHLITVLEAIPAEKFDLTDWRKEGSAEEPCGTVACAIGWACLDPKFNAEGLVAVERRNTYCPRFDGFDHWLAVAYFFDITTPQAHYLFHADSYIGWNATPTAVINRIKKLIGE